MFKFQLEEKKKSHTQKKIQEKGAEADAFAFQSLKMKSGVGYFHDLDSVCWHQDAVGIPLCPHSVGLKFQIAAQSNKLPERHSKMRFLVRFEFFFILCLVFDNKAPILALMLGIVRSN